MQSNLLTALSLDLFEEVHGIPMQFFQVDRRVVSRGKTSRMPG